MADQSQLAQLVLNHRRKQKRHDADVGPVINSDDDCNTWAQDMACVDMHNQKHTTLTLCWIRNLLTSSMSRKMRFLRSSIDCWISSNCMCEKLCALAECVNI